MNEQPGRIDCDVLVVGGGINGAGIARDASGRGLRVVLCEKDDLAAHTSSASSKLIHGGLRYLEHYQFGLVRKALAEREILLRAAPHVARPLRFVMPVASDTRQAGERAAWRLRAGLFLYDHLARRDFLPASSSVDLTTDAAGASLQARFTHGFAYSDAWVDDARLVVLAALDARDHGATVLTRTRCMDVARVAPDAKGGAQGHAERWSARLAGPGGELRVNARCLVNATGPWAAGFLDAGVGGGYAATSAADHVETPGLRLVKGSHIVLPRRFEHDQAYLLQQPDGRVVFALPYERDFTLVGTTDVDYAGDPDRVAISPAETVYLCDAVNRYFSRLAAPADVVWSFAGVRPLIDGGKTGQGGASAASRDYRLATDATGAPLLSVFGGKVTTFRKLAEEAVDWIATTLGRPMPGWTAHACLPGGDVHGRVPAARAVLEFDAWLKTRQHQYAWLPPALVARWAHAYGTRMGAMLAHCRNRDDLGREIVPGLFEIEAAYLVRHEWATCAEDILWRRSKLGLHMPPGSAARLDTWLDTWMAAHPATRPALQARIDMTAS